MHVRSVDTDFSVVVDTGPLDPRANDITPWIGIRSEVVERLSADLLSLPFDRFVGTVGAFDYTLLRTKYRPWRDMSDLDRALAAIQEGEEIVRRFASLERLPEAWGQAGIAEPDPYRLVATCLLLGREDLVEAWLAYGERWFCESADEVCEQFRGFTQAVDEWRADHEGNH